MQKIKIGSVIIEDENIKQLIIKDDFKSIDLFLNPKGLFGKESKKQWEADKEITVEIYQDDTLVIDCGKVENFYYEVVYRGVEQGFEERVNIILVSEIQ